MKRILLLLLVTVSTVALFAQAPQAFKYQAIARDEAGNLLINNPIGLQVSMVEGNGDGDAKYVETHHVKSNPFGIVNLVIGEGQVVKGNFADVNWGENSYFVKIEMDITGGIDYKEMGITQLYAVPYALYAEEAGHFKQQIPSSGNTEATPPVKRTPPVSGSRETPNSKISSSDDSWLSALTGNVGIGTSNPDDAALLEISSTSKGFLPPRMTTSEMNAITNPPEGLVIYNTSLKTLCCYDGSQWTHSSDGKSCGLIDYGGQIYKTVIIGFQCWMAENINIGTWISTPQDQIDNETIEKYCYLNSETNCDTYGGLYKWNEAMNWVTDEGAQGICPDGWHIATDEEWKILEGNIDSNYPVGDSEWDDTGWRGSDAGGKMKEIGTEHWLDPNTGATNSSGFTGLPGGYFNHTGSWAGITTYTLLWTSTELDVNNAGYHGLTYSRTDVLRNFSYKIIGSSVRCLKDE
jgi:uncharacterized protein (TIGR02145 family)